MFNHLEGDGVIDNLYHLLWTKDSVFENTHTIKIPHTILYKYQKPCYWYFTSIANNQIKKKTSSKVTISHIEEVFLKNISNSGIVAYYIYKKSGIDSKYEIDSLNKNNLEFESELDFNNQGDKEKNSKYVIEYFNKLKFQEFLRSKNTYPDGILQKFVDPKGENNFLIRLIWSPKLCVLEKKINTKRIYDNRYNIYERAVTYDGEEFQTETEAIRGNNIPDRFEKIGNNIANHISNITLERIKIVRMILNFKIDKNDRFYFLWCSSLRIENNMERKFTTKKEKNGNDLPFISTCDIEKMSVTYPNNVNLFQYSKQGKPIKVNKNIYCRNCDQTVESHKMCDILFRTLVEAHDSRKRDKNYNKLFENINITANGIELLPYIPNKGENENKLGVIKNYKTLLIPKVIYALFPRLNYEDYLSIKKDIVFQSKKTQVCEKCFLEMTSYCNFSGSNTQNVLRVLKSNIPEETLYKGTFRRKKNESSENNNISLAKINRPFQTAKNFNSNSNFNSNLNSMKSKVNSKTQINYFSNQNTSKNSLENKDKEINFDRFKPDLSSKIKFLKETKKMELENPVIKEKEEIIYEKEIEKDEIINEKDKSEVLNDYDIQSPLIDSDLKKAENYINFLDDKINAIIKESNFEKSNLENESQSMSKSEKMSFMDESNKIIKEKNESFKEWDIGNGSKKEESIKKSEENKGESESDDDGYDNENMEEDLIEDLNEFNNKKNRVPESVQILEYDDKNVKKDLILQADIGSIGSLGSLGSIGSNTLNIEKSAKKIEGIEMDTSNISKKSKLSNKIKIDNQNEMGENEEKENNQIEEENFTVENEIKDENEN